jgi:alpha-N-acetylglucosaminidase
MLTGGRMETKDFEAAVKDWEWQWVNSHEQYESEAKGNAVEIATMLYKKYRQLMW